jgi:CRP-like cAMP-binding protein
MFAGLVERIQRTGEGTVDIHCQIKAPGAGAWAQPASPELAGALTEAGERRQWKSGQRIFAFGDPAEGVYLILSGKARAALPGGPGRELMRLTAAEGSLLGLPSALCSKSYQFDVVALEAIEAVYLPVERVNRLLRERPELGMQMMTMMCAEMDTLRQTREHMSRCQNRDCGMHGYCVQASQLV